MTKQADDLQAVRSLVETLEPFQADDRERIIRWAREKLGMTTPAATPTSQVMSPPAAPPSTHAVAPAAARPSKDVKSFLDEKNPKSDRQLAAAVAYYYAFEASGQERKEAIGPQDLIDACRKAGRHRPTNPAQTLRNAAHAGYLDKAPEAGHYKLNAVGENLVAMVLPGGDAESKKKRGVKRKPTQRGGGKKRRVTR